MVDGSIFGQARGQILDAFRNMKLSRHWTPSLCNVFGRLRSLGLEAIGVFTGRADFDRSALIVVSLVLPTWGYRGPDNRLKWARDIDLFNGAGLLVSCSI